MEVTINIDGQALSVEVTVEVYEYLDRADHKEENFAHEKRRHWDSREFGEYIALTEGRSCYYQTPEQWVCRKETMLEIKAALALCTEAQRRRFLLYALEGLSYAEIAGLCRCSKAAIKNPPDLAHARIYDRIMERCAPVLFSGRNFREEKAAATKEAARGIVSPK